MGGYQRDKDSSPNLSWSFLFPPWVVDEKYGLDQSEAASHTMRHELSLPPFPFPFAFDQWKNTATDEDESSKSTQLDQNSLITCCVLVMWSFDELILSDMLDISGLTVHIRSGLGWNNIIHEL